MDLPLDDRLTIGVQTIHRHPEPAGKPWLPRERDGRAFVELGRTASASIRSGPATTSPSRSRSSIRSCSSPRPRRTASG